MKRYIAVALVVLASLFILGTDFDSFYSEYRSATDVAKPSFNGTYVEANGVVTNVQENYSTRTYGNVKYIVRINIRESIYVNVGTDDDVADLRKGVTVTVDGYFTDYSDFLIEETISLANGHVVR
jgi:hypothetical protein